MLDPLKLKIQADMDAGDPNLGSLEEQQACLPLSHFYSFQKCSYSMPTPAITVLVHSRGRAPDLTALSETSVPTHNTGMLGSEFPTFAHWGRIQTVAVL